MKYLQLVLLIFIYSCSQKESQPFTLPDNVENFLATESGKTWKIAQRHNGKTRMNMGDCFMAHRQIYRTDYTMHTDSKGNYDCGEALEATWKIIIGTDSHPYLKLTSNQIPTLFHMEENYKFMRILNLEENLIILQYYHDQFSGQKSRITDILVPEEVNVEGRDFHW